MSIERVEYDDSPQEATIAELLLERQRVAGTVVDYLAQTEELFQRDADFRPIYLQMQRLATIYGTSAMVGNLVDSKKALGFLQGALLAAPVGLEYADRVFAADWHAGLYRQLSALQIETHRMATITQNTLLNDEVNQAFGLVMAPRKFFVVDPCDTASRMSGFIEALLEDAETQEMYFHEEFAAIIDAWAPELTSDSGSTAAMKVGFRTVIARFFLEIDEREARRDAYESLLQERQEREERMMEELRLKAKEVAVLGNLDFAAPEEMA